ncbi:MAG: Gfo/Idh/MocA family oxidoreductase [Ruminococcaceae bacterium]|nr:Gfo/Idh/MocA family oxidoreductase [Oscillospiraceae bacterium]
MKSKLQIGYIGHGGRGKYHINNFLKMPDVDVVAVCDKYPDRAEAMVAQVEEKSGITPYSTTNYKDMIKNCKLDAVVIVTNWNMHIPISIDFMEAGIPVGCEVGGCDSIDEIWQLVETYRRTKTEFMMLENCCYGQKELMVLNMVKQGLFGEVVHCDGGYRHYLCDEILTGEEKRQYRLKNYIHRNCDNYPTHALGPIAKILNINHGNRFVTLTSMASKSVGLNAYMEKNEIENKKLIGQKFNQGDVIVTNIKCANGETITLNLSTTLPAFYSRSFNIYGTNAFYHEDTKSLAFLGDDIDLEKPWQPNWNNQEQYFEKYNHPIWKEYLDEGISEGHGGMDYLVCRAFVEAIKRGTKPLIDVYDAASWMAITPLSEASIAMGSAPVSFPDFTYGQWIEEDHSYIGKYSLDEIVDDPSVKLYPDKD